MWELEGLIPAKSAILSKNFCGFSQGIQKNTAGLSPVSPQSLFVTFLSYLLLVLPFGPL